MSLHERTPTRIERAGIIRDVVLSLDRSHGKWTTVDQAGGGIVRVREIDAGLGWSAYVTSRFSGVSNDVPARGRDEPTMRRALPSQVNDVVMDVWAGAGRKVLSLAINGNALMLIRMVPGPWEGLFGVAAAATPSIGRTGRRAGIGQASLVRHHA